MFTRLTLSSTGGQRTPALARCLRAGDEVDLLPRSQWYLSTREDRIVVPYLQRSHDVTPNVQLQVWSTVKASIPLDMILETDRPQPVNLPGQDPNSIDQGYFRAPDRDEV